MRKLMILGFVILSGCSSKAATYTFYCVTPVGIANGEGTFTPSKYGQKDVEFTTETGVTVTTSWNNCVGVKK